MLESAVSGTQTIANGNKRSLKRCSEGVLEPQQNGYNALFMGV